jgi:broad specificity phosphatase PhoE
MRHGADCIVAIPVTRGALLLVLASLAAQPSIARAQEAIYIVRHAERLDQSADSELSTDGIGRSFKLRDLLREAGITHIFTSEMRRTIETAKPLADALHLTPQTLPGGEVEALASRLGSLGAGARALVVGHSNTLPQILRALKVDAPVTIADADYDNLFIVVPRNDRPPAFLRLKF